MRWLIATEFDNKDLLPEDRGGFYASQVEVFAFVTTLARHPVWYGQTTLDVDCLVRFVDEWKQRRSSVQIAAPLLAGKYRLVVYINEKPSSAKISYEKLLIISPPASVAAMILGKPKL